MKGKHNPITLNMKKGIGNWMKGTLKQSLNSKYEERRRITNKMKPKATLELEIWRTEKEYKWKEIPKSKYEKRRLIMNEKKPKTILWTRNMKKGDGIYMKGNLKQSLITKYEERRMIMNERKPKTILELEI